MLTYQNNSDTAIVVLHEIYGVNQHIRDVCERLRWSHVLQHVASFCLDAPP